MGHSQSCNPAVRGNSNTGAPLSVGYFAPTTSWASKYHRRRPPAPCGRVNNGFEYQPRQPLLGASRRRDRHLRDSVAAPAWAHGASGSQMAHLARHHLAVQDMCYCSTARETPVLCVLTVAARPTSGRSRSLDMPVIPNAFCGLSHGQAQRLRGAWYVYAKAFPALRWRS